MICSDCLHRWPFRFRKWSWEEGRRDRAAFCPRKEDTESLGSSWVQTTPSRTGDPTRPVTMAPDGGQPTIWMDCFCVLFFHLLVFCFCYTSLCTTQNIWRHHAIFLCYYVHHCLFLLHSCLCLHLCHARWFSTYYILKLQTLILQVRTDFMCERTLFVISVKS